MDDYDRAIQPTFYVIQIPKAPQEGMNEFIGGFDTEDAAGEWAGHNMPARMMFRIVPVFGRL